MKIKKRVRETERHTHRQSELSTSLSQAAQDVLINLTVSFSFGKNSWRKKSVGLNKSYKDCLEWPWKVKPDYRIPSHEAPRRKNHGHRRAVEVL